MHPGAAAAAADPAAGCSAGDTSARIRVGVSGCLLGEEVRYDGGHKLDRYVTGVLGRWFEHVSFCPEALAGLGVPRPPIRLTGDPAAVRVGDDSIDMTQALQAAARRAVPEMGTLRGVIFKRASPSRGMERVKVHSPANIRSGRYRTSMRARHERSQDAYGPTDAPARGVLGEIPAAHMHHCPRRLPC